MSSEDIFNNFKSVVEKNIKKKIEEELIDMGNVIVKETIPVTPLEYGSLRSTIRAETETKKDEITMQVGVAGNYKGKESPNAPTGYVNYAIVMHEDLTYTPHTPGTGPKYLEKTVNKLEKELHNRFLKRIKL